ncbi:sugar porter family MFS transporter [Galactobacter caseinivorans]|uniref:MFS transporter n=1 Tax=Galactobacter caseinivorans TaxID=2676123 RepID=A0A496PHF2_9MICC|nr:sugar porter family MFS transporter [Galactobacter caseinivorans]RKW69905.1 MFS transporter [Galactobacter caseinivorans]
MSTSAQPTRDGIPLKVIMVSVVAALGGLLFGFDSSVINGAVDAIQDRWNLSGAITGFVVSVALIGAMVGAWFAGSIADRFGRIRAMLLAATLFAVSSVGSAFCFDIIDLSIWRAVGGVGVGMASVIAPAYIAEIAPARVRGRLGSLQQLAIVTGIFLALLSDAFIANTAGGAAQPVWLGLEAWRWMFLVEVVPAVLYGVLALMVPESPRYLVAKGDLARAKLVLRDVVGLRTEEAVEHKIEDIERTSNAEARQSLRDLKGPAWGLMPVVWIGIALSVFQQFVGINVIFYYSTTLWRSVGFSESDSFTVSVITSVTNIVVTIVAIALVDKVGRRPMLLVGSAGMAVALGVMALAFSQSVMVDGAVSLPGAWGMVALVAANAFVVAFGATWGPVVWVLLGEMFPNRVRAIALSVAAAAQWLANFLVTTTFPTLSEIGLTLAYGIYAFFALLSLWFVARYVKETKGKELEDM